MGWLFKRITDSSLPENPPWEWPFWVSFFKGKYGSFGVEGNDKTFYYNLLFVCLFVSIHKGRIGVLGLWYWKAVVLTPLTW